MYFTLAVDVYSLHTHGCPNLRSKKALDYSLQFYVHRILSVSSARILLVFRKALFPNEILDACNLMYTFSVGAFHCTLNQNASFVNLQFPVA
jgi:hypothetical protein